MKAIGMAEWCVEKRKVHSPSARRALCQCFPMEEFDPGSERTLAAWLRHASRTRLARSSDPASPSGERESTKQVTYLGHRDSPPKGGLIPGDVAIRMDRDQKVGPFGACRSGSGLFPISLLVR